MQEGDQLRVVHIAYGYKVLQGSRGYVVSRINGTYEQHAHIQKYSTCLMLLNLIHDNKLPTDKYLQESCRRLQNDDEYRQLRQKKQSYYNVRRR